MKAKQKNTKSDRKTADPVFVLHHRYMKDSSFENPGAPTNRAVPDPKINIGLKIEASYGDDLYEVELTYRIEATKNASISFLAEVVYAGLFGVTGATADQLSRFIYVEAPRMLYPHAAKIIMDAVRDGGLPDLGLEEPDFLTLWQTKGASYQGPELTLPLNTFNEIFGEAPKALET